MATPSEIYFVLAIGLVAMLYSSVGHGGASGYLALMALFGIDVAIMKPSALILNLFVSSIAFIAYYNAGHFKWRILLPFVAASIPMAFLGATLEVPPELYKKILGVSLFIASLTRLPSYAVKSVPGVHPAPFRFLFYSLREGFHDTVFFDAELLIIEEAGNKTTIGGKPEPVAYPA